MIRRLAAVMACLTVAAVALPSPARAGTFVVRACHSDGINNSWQAFRSNAYADAYIQCPGGALINGHFNEGMVARNTGGTGSAPAYSHAEVFFNAPAGARIVGMSGQIMHQGTGNWDAGIHDDTANRWLWCGDTCLSTFGNWLGFNIGGLSTGRVSALAICAAGRGCARDTRHGYAALKDVSVVVADDNAPRVAITGGSLVARGWRRGVQDVVVEAGDAVGIREITAVVDGVEQRRTGHPCDDTRAVPCTSGSDTLPIDSRQFRDGRHTLTVNATDAAANVASTTRTIYVDNTAPLRPSAIVVDGGTGWRARNGFTLRWNNPVQRTAPIADATVAICSVQRVSSDHRGCALTTQLGDHLRSLHGIRVPGPGVWRARVWLRDNAGNENPSSVTEAVLRFDDRAPALAFQVPAIDRPTLLRVRASDEGSGIAVREILYRRRGRDTWTSLETRTESNGFSAYLNDEHLPDGVYELRARATDQAGNELSSDQWPDGKPAQLALPLRIKTRLAVGRPRRVRARGANGKRRYRIVLVERPQSRYGRTIPLRGRLTSPGGNPLPGRQVQVLEQTHLPAAPWRPIATVRTGRSGRFTFKALRGPSRTLRFRFGGTETIRGRTADVRLGVRAVTTMSVTPHSVVNGEGVTFRGRLRGRPLPTTGKLVEIQARARGRWLTFATVRASRSGRWAYPYRFAATRGNVRYRFRVRVPKESGYPFETGTSRTVRVRVRGL